MYAFYHWGLSCLPRLCVALKSFRDTHPNDVAYLCIPVWDSEAAFYAKPLSRTFDVHIIRVDMPADIEGGIKNMAKMFCIDALPDDQHVALYESDMLFVKPTHRLFDCTADFGMCHVPPLMWGSDWMKKRLHLPRWAGFPLREPFLNPSAKRYNAGLWYIKTGSSFCTEFWKNWKSFGHIYATVDPKFIFAEEHLANGMMNTALLRLSSVPYTVCDVSPDFNVDIRYIDRTYVPNHSYGVLHFVENSFLTRKRIPDWCADVWWSCYRTLRHHPSLQPVLNIFPRLHPAYVCF